MTGFRLRGDITNVEVIAVNRGIRDLEAIVEAHGKGRWRKLKGQGLVELPTDKMVWAELHWYEAHGCCVARPVTVVVAPWMAQRHIGSGTATEGQERGKVLSRQWFVWSDHFEGPCQWNCNGNGRSVPLGVQRNNGLGRHDMKVKRVIG